MAKMSKSEAAAEKIVAEMAAEDKVLVIRSDAMGRAAYYIRKADADASSEVMIPRMVAACMPLARMRCVERDRKVQVWVAR